MPCDLIKYIAITERVLNIIEKIKNQKIDVKCLQKPFIY